MVCRDFSSTACARSEPTFHICTRMIKRKKEAAMSVVVFFVIVCVWWFQRIQRKYMYERLCCCEVITDKSLEEPLTVTNSIGRARRDDNGEWFSQTRPFHVHIYSAFFDNRSTLRSEPQLAIIAVIDRRLLLHERLWCHVWYRAVDEAVVLRADLEPAGAGRLIADGNELVEHVITCPVETDKCAPVSVALAWGSSVSDRTPFRVPVEVIEKTSNQQRNSLAVCVSVSFGHIDTSRLVEWLEMQQILGAQLVVIYNHSVSPSVGHVLSQYINSAADGTHRAPVTLRQTRAFLPDTDVLLHMSPVINDCIYRFSGQFRYFAVIDLDELIIPRHVYTIPALIETLSVTNTMPVALFVFRNAYFFLDISVDDIDHSSQPNAAQSTYLVHRRRLAASPPAYSVKSIVDSQACIAMHNHYCWSYAPDALSSWNLRLDVAPSDALLHHYKLCHLDSYLQQRGHCRNVMSSTVVDDVINKYRTVIADRLYRHRVRFNVTAVS